MEITTYLPFMIHEKFILQITLKATLFTRLHMEIHRKLVTLFARKLVNGTWSAISHSWVSHINGIISNACLYTVLNVSFSSSPIGMAPGSCVSWQSHGLSYILFSLPI